MHLNRPFILYSFLPLILGVNLTLGHDFTDDFDYLFTNYAPLRTNCNFADQIVPVLNECGIVDIFKEDLFNRTSSLNKRDLLDFPLFQTPMPTDDNVVIKASAFWTMTNKDFFTGSQSNIGSYFGINNDSLVNKIEQFFTNVKDNPDCNEFFIGFLGLPINIFNINIAQITGIISKATVQERRFGVFGQIMKNMGPWTFGIQVPVLVQERNFFINQQEVDAIDIGVDVPPATDEQINQFAQSHLISDKAGFGDSRLILAYQASNNEKLDLQLQAIATAPTAIAVQKGIFGSEFPKQCLTLPEFDLCTILNLGLTPDALEHRLKHDVSILTDEFLDRLSADLLEDSLGNGHHWGLGFIVEPTLKLNDFWSWHTRAFFEYLFPANESRFFIKDVDLSQFNSRYFNSRDADVAESNLMFLNNRLLMMLFPNSVNVVVRPGPISQLTSDVTFQAYDWWVNVGNDVWFQGREHIKFGVDENGFDTSKVFKPFAFQYRLFGGISRAFYREHSSWLLSLKADGTVASSGIGKDFMIVLSATTTW
jgi:hypothetical protein